MSERTRLADKAPAREELQPEVEAPGLARGKAAPTAHISANGSRRLASLYLRRDPLENAYYSVWHTSPIRRN